MFSSLPHKHFGAIYADPAWTFVTRSKKGKGRSPEKHYGCMSIDEIKALPVADLAAEDCVLFLWVTDPLLPLGMEVMKAWGFTYKTVAFNWVKLNKGAKGWPDPYLKDDRLYHPKHDFFTGMGYWTRANPELCLLGTRGSPKRRNADVKRLVIDHRREHSRKPDCVPARIERLVNGPYLELFARTQRRGWSSWGNETAKFTKDVSFLDAC